MRGTVSFSSKAVADPCSNSMQIVRINRAESFSRIEEKGEERSTMDQ